MAKALKELADHVASAAKDAVISTDIAYGEVTVLAHVEKLIRLLAFLRDDPLCAFHQLIDITAVDRPNRSERFELVYHLLSMTLNQRIRVKVCAGEDTPAPTATEIFPNADWYEREVFDLYGVLFAGHPDLRRILTDYGFQGHPLRKDFPLTGFVEVRYDEEEKRVVYEDVQLQQEYRDFDFISPWEGMTRELPGDEKAGR